MSTILTKEELDRIEAAVRDAESRTSGEIVPFVVERSATYSAALYRGGATAIVVGLAALLVLSLAYAGWNLGWLFTVEGTALVVLVAGLTGAFFVRTVPSLERFFAGVSSMHAAVQSRAANAFLREEVFNTRERTGILLFVSLFERRVEVVGDTGINERVQPDDWADVVSDILSGVRGGTLADGLVNAVERCGGLLESKGVEIRSDDTNELSDSVRFDS